MLQQTIRYLRDVYGVFFQYGDSGIANLTPPELILGRGNSKVRGDLNRQLAEWFLLSFLPVALRDGNCSSVDLVYHTHELVKQAWPNAMDDEKFELTELLAEIATSLYVQDRDTRRPIDPALSQQLFDGSGGRCEICGFRFPVEGVERFLGFGRRSPSRREFTDFLKPVTAKSIRMTIEVDHINPVSWKGCDSISNLQLLCQYCNHSKSDYRHLFAARSRRARRVEHPSLGRIALPDRFDVTRTLSDGRCSSCGRTNKEIEITVAYDRPRCEGNVVNLFVTCYECDPLKPHRFVKSTNMS